jgi:enoyl-CoA hydratase/carnithine racemase
VTDSAENGRITVSTAGGVATVQIDNPTQRNAVTRSMCLELQALMPALDADPTVTIITLRGVGATFSSGAPINSLTSVLLDRQDDGSLVDQLSRADEAITSVTKPTIALVDGACMGGGWQIAAACDFILASARSLFAITPAKLGVLYPRRGIERLVRLVGQANAKYILFTAETFSAARAQELGLVADVVATEEFEAHCSSLVEGLQTRSRFSTHALKRLVDVSAEDGPQADDEWERAWAAMADSADMSIGVEAFLRRDQPRFTWSPESASAT